MTIMAGSILASRQAQHWSGLRTYILTHRQQAERKAPSLVCVFAASALTRAGTSPPARPHLIISHTGLLRTIFLFKPPHAERAFSPTTPALYSQLPASLDWRHTLTSGAPAVPHPGESLLVQLVFTSYPSVCSGIIRLVCPIGERERDELAHSYNTLNVQQAPRAGHGWSCSVTLVIADKHKYCINMTHSRQKQF